MFVLLSNIFYIHIITPTEHVNTWRIDVNMYRIGLCLLSAFSLEEEGEGVYTV